MLVESIDGSRLSQVRPSDMNAQPGRSERSVGDQKEIPKTEEAIVKENQAPVEITQEVLNVVGENFKMILHSARYCLKSFKFELCNNFDKN